MIVAHLAEPYLRAALRRAAHPEEDVVLDPGLALEALEVGYPRLAVVSAGFARSPVARRVMGVPLVRVDRETLASWEGERLSVPPPPPRVEYYSARFREVLERESAQATWADRTLADLERAAGASLPRALKGFGRRILEFPSRYSDLGPLARMCRLTPGALKARFRRRGLPSPSGYLRWFRILASANLLADRSVTVARVAHRMGYTSDGNLCRAMLGLTGLTPTEARTVRGWNRLLVTFAWSYLGRDPLREWRGLDTLFVRTEDACARRTGGWR